MKHIKKCEFCNVENEFIEDLEGDFYCSHCEMYENCGVEKKEFIDYLYSHIEIEHVLLDSYEMYQTENLHKLSLGQLQYLSRLYDYEK